MALSLTSVILGVVRVSGVVSVSPILSDLNLVTLASCFFVKPYNTFLSGKDRHRRSDACFTNLWLGMRIQRRLSLASRFPASLDSTSKMAATMEETVDKQFREK
jgi:hypothetical protein